MTAIFFCILERRHCQVGSTNIEGVELCCRQSKKGFAHLPPVLMLLPGVVFRLTKKESSSIPQQHGNYVRVRLSASNRVATGTFGNESYTAWVGFCL